MAYQQTLANGTVLIEEFQILGHLGSGGFANTYLAMDLTLGREVAVKEYFPSELAVRSGDARVEVKSQAHGAQFEWALGRFVREAKTLAKFRHPSVVRVFRVFNANHTAYIVLEFVRGSNMEAWLKGLGRQPTQAELDELLPPLLDALEVVHSAGILHRDIKPANIYIRASDHTPVLLDFGAARYAAGDYAGTTAAIVSKGYSPHEAYATDSRLQGPWTDIYGLAATIYRALAGSAPPESTMRVLEDHCVAATELDLPASGGYRPDFLAAVDWALGVMPKQRPQSVAEWRHKLLPVSASMPRLRDANGDPTTVQEWNPLSDRDSDATTFDPPGGPGSDRRVASASSSGAQARASRPSGTSQPAPAGERSNRPSVIVGVSTSTSGTVRPRSSGSIAASRTTSAPQVPSHSGVTDRQSQPLGNRAFMIGIVLFAAGGIALLGQWFMSRKPAPVQIAAPLSSPDGRGSSAIDRNRIEREQRQAAEAARTEDDRRVAEETARQQREAEAKRVAEETARQQREAEAKRVAEEAARQQREAEAKRVAEETARQQREAEAKRVAEETARQQREAEAKRLADEKARQEREAEAKRLAEEKARQEREAEAKRLADEKARQQREAEAKRVADEKARQEREAEAKRLADEKARTANEAIKVAANTAAFSTGPDRDFPLTGAVGGEEGARRTAYLKQIQTVLKNSRCYDGAVTGDVDATRSALEMFEKNYRGSMKKVDVASASSSDLEVWLGWFWRQESSSCAGAPDASRRDREAEEARQERRRQREAEEARQERQRERAAEEARQERARQRDAEEARQERARQRERAAEQARQRQREERPAKKVEREKPAKQVYKAPPQVYRAPKSSGGGGGGGSSDLLRGGR